MAEIRKGHGKAFKMLQDCNSDTYYTIKHENRNSYDCDIRSTSAYTLYQVQNQRTLIALRPHIKVCRYIFLD